MSANENLSLGQTGCADTGTNEANADEVDVDISDILMPDESKIVLPPMPFQAQPSSIESTAEAPIAIESREFQEFLYVHQEQRPLLNNQPEFYSSSTERVKLTRPRLPDLAAKKLAQRRMRIIVLIDIVLFIVILGVIYPSLRKLQSNAKLGAYRFGLSLSMDFEQGQLNIVAKTEKLADNREPVDSYQIHIAIAGQDLLTESRKLPDMGSPVSYALFSIPYRDIPAELWNSDSGLDIDVTAGDQQKQFYLALPKMEP